MIKATDLHDNGIADRLAMGQVTLTAKNQENGEHLTLRLHCKNQNLKKRYIEFDDAVIIAADVPAHGRARGDMVGFVVIKGPNNQVRPNKYADPDRVAVFSKVWNYILTGELEGFDLEIESYCGHCGRPLNDPLSIERGFGPDCFGQATKSKHMRRKSKEEIEAQQSIFTTDEAALIHARNENPLYETI